VLPAGTGSPDGPVERGEAPTGPTAARTLNGIVYGLPVPQGSKSATVRGGRAVMFEDNKSTHRWRRLIVRTVAADIDVAPRFFGPVTIAVTFTFPRPRSAPRRVVWPATRSSGDLDKLLRALFDALTTAGVWEDDARVVGVTARKVYLGHPYALDAPGVQFCIGTAA
jgi:Holliday junction resolvase RusA-like endonuclease